MTHLLELPEHVQRLTKPFTIENLRMDAACKPGMEFVIPIIESGGDVATALKCHNGDWVQWAITKGYDVRHLWCEGYTWNERGHMFLTAGHSSTLTAGHSSTLTAGHSSTLTAGDESTLTAGDYSTLKAGHGSTLTAGHSSTLTAGDYSTLTAGDYSTLKAGHGSTLTAGDESTLTAGDESTLTAGHGSTLTAGHDSNFCAGNNSYIISWGHVDGGSRRVCAFVGKGGLMPDTFYTLKDGEWVEVTE